MQLSLFRNPDVVWSIFENAPNSPLLCEKSEYRRLATHASLSFVASKMLKRGRGDKEEDEDKRKGASHVKWDEVVIAEHDKLRGTRQKIDEPPTPYEYGSGDENEASSDCEGDGDGQKEGGGGNVLMENWELVKAKLQYQNAMQSESTQSVDDATQGAAVARSVGDSEPIHHDSVFFNSNEMDRDAVEQGMEPQVEGFGGSETESSLGHSTSAFKNKRAAHYNEFQLMKAMRDSEAMSESDGDGDDSSSS